MRAVRSALSCGVRLRCVGGLSELSKHAGATRLGRRADQSGSTQRLWEVHMLSNVRALALSCCLTLSLVAFSPSSSYAGRLDPPRQCGFVVKSGLALWQSCSIYRQKVAVDYALSPDHELCVPAHGDQYLGPYGSDWGDVRGARHVGTC